MGTLLDMSTADRGGACLERFRLVSPSLLYSGHSVAQKLLFFNKLGNNLQCILKLHSSASGLGCTVVADAH